MSVKLWRCNFCHKIWPDAELLVAPNPFYPEDTLSGCPGCKSCDDFQIVCDEPGCKLEGGCGWPSPEGYRHTCYEHSTWGKERAASAFGVKQDKER